MFSSQEFHFYKFSESKLYFSSNSQCMIHRDSKWQLSTDSCTKCNFILRWGGVKGEVELGFQLGAQGLPYPWLCPCLGSVLNVSSFWEMSKTLSLNIKISILNAIYIDNKITKVKLHNNFILKCII